MKLLESIYVKFDTKKIENFWDISMNLAPKYKIMKTTSIFKLAVSIEENFPIITDICNSLHKILLICLMMHHIKTTYC